jgi:glucoamylase
MSPSPGSAGADPSAVAPYVFALMQRNISTAGFVIADHNNSAAPPVAGLFSAPGCILASPSWAVGNNFYPGNVAELAEDYAFNWTRDSAITVSAVLKQVAGQLPAQAAQQILANYVNFVAACQANDPNHLGQAKYTPEGSATGSADEADGPALRILTILQGIAAQSAPPFGTAAQVINNDLGYLLNNNRYQQTTVTLWEDTVGQSIFARAVQLRSLNQVLALPPGSGISAPAGAASAVTYLSGQLASQHWDNVNNRYVSVLGASRLWGDAEVAYDPAIDPILACLYGDGISYSDPKLLSTAAQVRALWTAGGTAPYQINANDGAIGVGPMVGRYNGDQYNGVVLNSTSGHPWAVCTCSFAQLYYQLAQAINGGTIPVPSDPLSAPFLGQVDITGDDSVASAAAKLQAAGDSMLNAVVRHSNNFELSEQFDATTGYELSVSNLTWSYAAFLLAIGARGATM